MAKILISPSKYLQGAGEMKKIGTYASNCGKKALVLISKGGYKRIGKMIEDSFAESTCEVVFDYFNGECCNSEIDRLVNIVKENQCDLVIGIYLFVILAVLPLYNRGYAQIGTDKENFFIKTMTYVGKCLLPVFVLWLILRFIVVKQKQELPEFRTIPKRIWQALNTTDKFAALYGIAVVMSYVFTRYREEALWGTASWRMGMWTQLGAVIVYFMISRMWQRNDWIVILTLPVSTIVFFLGYMNKFGLCLVDKEIINSSFISTVGNINWYCGYLVTVLFGGVYLLWWMGSEITWKRALLMGYVTIGFASLVTQGSSSGVVTLAVMLFVLFGMSVKDGRKMECFWQEMTLLSVACLITYILRSCNVLSQELPMEKVTDILTFSAMSVIMTIVSVVVLWLVHTSNNRNQYRGKLFWGIYRILCVALPVVSVALLAFILANTLLGGELTSFLTETAGDGGSNWLVFSAAWGSHLVDGSQMLLGSRSVT